MVDKFKNGVDLTIM